ncbi:hypothetical protein C8R44DRAFT_751465 [Mycena epipterygia]|nr:hypothetical protein C8R44DRAFT_751465 [Mycena epipterygia]
MTACRATSIGGGFRIDAIPSLISILFKLSSARQVVGSRLSWDTSSCWQDLCFKTKDVAAQSVFHSTFLRCINPVVRRHSWIDPFIFSVNIKTDDKLNAKFADVFPSSRRNLATFLLPTSTQGSNLVGSSPPQELQIIKTDEYAVVDPTSNSRFNLTPLELRPPSYVVHRLSTFYFVPPLLAALPTGPVFVAAIRILIRQHLRGSHEREPPELAFLLALHTPTPSSTLHSYNPIQKATGVGRHRQIKHQVYNPTLCRHSYKCPFGYAASHRFSHSQFYRINQEHEVFHVDSVNSGVGWHNNRSEECNFSHRKFCVKFCVLTPSEAMMGARVLSNSLTWVPYPFLPVGFGIQKQREKKVQRADLDLHSKRGLIYPRLGTNSTTTPLWATAMNVDAPFLSVKAKALVQIIQTNIAKTHLHRAALTAKRFGSGPTMSQRPPAGTTLTTSTLLSHENGGGAPGEDKILIGWAVRESKTPKSINPDLGTSAKKWAVSVPLPDIKSHLVKTVNVEWGRSNSVPLEPDEVTFRWHGVLYLLQYTESCINLLVDCAHLMEVVAKSNKGPTIWLELYIDSAAYKHRLAILKAKSEGVAASSMDSMMTSTLTSSVRKRALSSTSEGSNRDEANKRSNISGVMKSMFVPSSSGTVKVHKHTSVTLNQVICVTDSITGQVEFEDTSKVISGTIRDVCFSEGAMKHAYDFKTASGEALVVKRFYRISDDNKNTMAPPVTIIENRDQIYLELRCLSISAYFLKEFFAHAKCHGVGVYTAITIADAWLGQEIGQPSKASETSRIDEAHEGITWLVETKRATTVEHFTFTLNHQTHRQDLCAQTIHAFAHFVYGNSNRNVVLADIQGTPAHQNGRDLLVLFDPMTHTPAGDSGIGDFGPKGIQSFIHDHKCGDVCRSLGLHESIVLENEAPEEPPQQATPDSPDSQQSQ